VTKNKTLLIAVVATAAAMAAFWFLALAPKREEAAALNDKIAAKETELATAQATLAGYRKSKDNYGSNYATVVRLGKAVPEDDDIRSLLVQLDAEAGGTNVDFRTVEIGGGANAGAAAADPAASGTAGFETTAFAFTFKGTYENLQQFMARMERFVNLRNEKMNVTGRLLRLETIDMQVDALGYPRIIARIAGKSYQVPETQGLTAGATPAGPAAPTPAATPAPAGGPSVPTTTATVPGAK
jgi:Tfp pilus assembly protein PilO